MSILTMNLSNIEMRDVEDLEQGDIIVRHEFDHGSLRVQAWRVFANATFISQAGERKCELILEALNCGLQGDGNGHFGWSEDPRDQRKTVKFTDAWDTVAVVVGS